MYFYFDFLYFDFGVTRVGDKDQGHKNPRGGEIFCSHPSFGICGIIGLATEGVRASVSKVRGESSKSLMRPVLHHERVQVFLVWRAGFLDHFRM